MNSSLQVITATWSLVFFGKAGMFTLVKSVVIVERVASSKSKKPGAKSGSLTGCRTLKPPENGFAVLPPDSPYVCVR